MTLLFQIMRDLHPHKNEVEECKGLDRKLRVWRRHAAKAMMFEVLAYELLFKITP